MKYYCAIDIGASSGRHILGRVENGRTLGNLMAQMIALGDLPDLAQARSFIDRSM